MTPTTKPARSFPRRLCGLRTRGVRAGIGRTLHCPPTHTTTTATTTGPRTSDATAARCTRIQTSRRTVRCMSARAVRRRSSTQGGNVGHWERRGERSDPSRSLFFRWWKRDSIKLFGLPFTRTASQFCGYLCLTIFLLCSVLLKLSQRGRKARKEVSFAQCEWDTRGVAHWKRRSCSKLVAPHCFYPSQQHNTQPQSRGVTGNATPKNA